jgi:hypothetical protein
MNARKGRVEALAGRRVPVGRYGDATRHDARSTKMSTLGP